MIEVVQIVSSWFMHHGCLFGASIRAEPQSLTLLGDWTTETSKVVLVFVRVRSGASAQLSPQWSSLWRSVLTSQWIHLKRKTVCHLDMSSTSSPKGDASCKVHYAKVNDMDCCMCIYQ
jgi:hypothetical protein